MKKSFVALLVVLLAISSFCFAAGASEDDGVLVIKGIYMNQAGYQMEDIEQMAAILPSEKPYLKTGILRLWVSRIPWLLLLMVSATFTSKIISSYEAALIRFEARMGSAIISDIVRGLIGILRGDDGRMYFQMLSHDLKALELQRLKAKAAKIPPKIRVFSFIMLMCFMMTYIVIIVYQIVNSLGSLF